MCVLTLRCLIGKRAYANYSVGPITAFHITRVTTIHTYIPTHVIHECARNSNVIKYEIDSKLTSIYIYICYSYLIC